VSDEEIKSPATVFLDAHPELRRMMSESEDFAELKKQAELEVDEDKFYIVKGDVLGGEDELYLDALAAGAKSASQDELRRRMFLELSDDLKSAVMKRFNRN